MNDIHDFENPLFNYIKLQAMTSFARTVTLPMTSYGNHQIIGTFCTNQPYPTNFPSDGFFRYLKSEAQKGFHDSKQMLKTVVPIMPIYPIGIITHKYFIEKMSQQNYHVGPLTKIWTGFLVGVSVAPYLNFCNYVGYIKYSTEHRYSMRGRSRQSALEICREVLRDAGYKPLLRNAVSNTIYCGSWFSHVLGLYGFYRDFYKKLFTEGLIRDKLKSIANENPLMQDTWDFLQFLNSPPLLHESLAALTSGTTFSLSRISVSSTLDSANNEYVKMSRIEAIKTVYQRHGLKPFVTTIFGFRTFSIAIEFFIIHNLAEKFVFKI